MKDDKPKSIEGWKYDREYFLTDCEGYETFKDFQGKKLSERLYEFYKKLTFYSEDRVLELGCGRGELCNAIAPHVRSIIGFDYSKAVIELCQETYRGVYNLDFIVGDVKNLPFPDNSFDIVYCTEMLEHLHDWELEEMMEEIVRVLNPKGRFVAQTEPNRIYRLASSAWSFLPRAIQSIRKGRTIHFLIERPIGHVRFHVNEQTPWSTKRLIKNYFEKYRIKTYEMILGMSMLGRFIFNAYPLNKLPWLRLLLNREIYIYIAKNLKSER